MVLFAVDGYRYGGKDHDRREIVADLLRRELPTPRARRRAALPSTARARDLGAADALTLGRAPDRGDGAELALRAGALRPPAVGALLLGTTGLPKAIVQAQGGILLEHLKKLGLHLDPQPGDRFFWYTTTGWMMWNFLVGGLLPARRSCSTTAAPATRTSARCGTRRATPEITSSALSAAYVAACRKAGVEPGRDHDLPRCGVGSTGSPLPPEGFRWVHERVGATSGSSRSAAAPTCAPRFVGGVPLLPVYAGELQARRSARGRGLGRARAARSIDEVGELVVTEPMPSMPLCFWNDPDGERYREQLLRHVPRRLAPRRLDQITRAATAVIYGRSDSTLNRQGVRMGTSEIYRAVRALSRGRRRARRRRPARRATESWMPLFVVLARGRRARRRARRARSSAASARTARPGTCPTRSADRRGPAHALGQGARGPGQADPDGRRRRPGGEPRVARQPGRARLLRRAGRRAGSETERPGRAAGSLRRRAVPRRRRRAQSPSERPTISFMISLVPP